MLTDDEIRQNKDEVISRLRSTGRDGIENVIDYLLNSGYFYLPGSFKHHKYKGGLAEHSLEVMNYALTNNKSCDESSIIISALLHDLCKTKYEFPEDIELVGHGSKSAGILELFLNFPLSYEEHNAIRFHMAGKAFIRNDDDARRYKDAKKSELWELIHTGDLISAGGYHNSMLGVIKKIVSIGIF